MYYFTVLYLEYYRHKISTSALINIALDPKFLANSTFKKIFPDIYNIALALNPHLKEAQAELLIQHPDCKYSNPRRLQVQFQQIFSHKP